MKTPTLALAALAAALLATAPAQAETRTCTAITSLPATLASPGVYCLKGDLATAMTTGYAVLVTSNDVQLDCNGYKLGGLAAGPSTQATGIGSTSMVERVTVRNCNLRGFRTGIDLNGHGLAVDGNRLDGSQREGIMVSGNGNLIRGNRVLDTGGEDDAQGIVVAGQAELRGNTITGVAGAPDWEAYGIRLTGSGAKILVGNRVRDVSTSGTGLLAGLRVEGGARLALRDNVFTGNGSGSGLSCDAPVPRVTRDTLVTGYATPASGCN